MSKTLNSNVNVKGSGSENENGRTMRNALNAQFIVIVYRGGERNAPGARSVSVKANL